MALKKYEPAAMKISHFEAEDVITTSTVSIPIGGDNPPTPDDSGTIWGD